MQLHHDIYMLVNIYFTFTVFYVVDSKIITLTGYSLSKVAKGGDTDSTVNATSLLHFSSVRSGLIPGHVIAGYAESIDWDGGQQKLGFGGR